MSKPLGELKKAITRDTASDVRRLAQMFAKLCAANPQAVEAAFGDYLKILPAEKRASMVQFYADNAAYIADLFDIN
jgi:hypothetical protein